MIFVQDKGLEAVQRALKKRESVELILILKDPKEIHAVGRKLAIAIRTARNGERSSVAFCGGDGLSVGAMTFEEIEATIIPLIDHIRHVHLNRSYDIG